ncbi:hypothetical protein [Actinokineospora sp. NBRC 105648]|uniref:hypothetical protein n=1 Tax=Actinokineospora sp. NBRC 105648 TaxID=3032206 RepID=UPI0024A4C6D9|nr:hypothetical protein [Actinokineospora sp. NBRC 105648]GLZ38249.1 hypothetical protein Acsp05_18730 [Actinokineospora sp. NBRC 105648]
MRNAHLSRVLLVAGCALVPWIVVLWFTASDAPEWRLAWVGFDTLEATGLLVSAHLLRRGGPRAAFATIATATLLFADAWFDVTTAASGFATSLALAVALELPLTAVCVLAALQALAEPTPPFQPAPTRSLAGQEVQAPNNGEQYMTPYDAQQPAAT